MSEDSPPWYIISIDTYLCLDKIALAGFDFLICEGVSVKSHNIIFFFFCNHLHYNIKYILTFSLFCLYIVFCDQNRRYTYSTFKLYTCACERTSSSNLFSVGMISTIGKTESAGLKDLYDASKIQFLMFLVSQF